MKPEYGISTRDAFIELDKHDCVLKDSAPFLKALIKGENNIGSYLHNCFIESQSLLKKELETVHIKTASKIIAKEITARKTISSLS